MTSETIDGIVVSTVLPDFRYERRHNDAVTFAVRQWYRKKIHASGAKIVFLMSATVKKLHECRHTGGKPSFPRLPANAVHVAGLSRN